MIIKKNKSGISTIIATLLLVVLTIILIAIVWVVVNNLVRGKISQSSACFGNFDKATLDSMYSCYDSNANEMHFSLNIGDISVDSVLVSISSPSRTKTVTITQTSQTIPGLSYLNGTTIVKLPDQNSGMTYIYDWNGSDVPDSIQISPTIQGQSCSVSDSITTIDNCLL
ncbi:MAG TPA: archaellin/type IV pilin N-terminal domain-containing protein [Candidatus Omnitrophota bacterium]|nr:archaellin/type IV pilin N-terminal domain-containing protein [Candidatus Omnitrophota bacterium]